MVKTYDFYIGPTWALIYRQYIGRAWAKLHLPCPDKGGKYKVRLLYEEAASNFISYIRESIVAYVCRVMGGFF